MFTLKCINLGRFDRIWALLWRTNQFFIYTCKFPQDLTSFPGSCAWKRSRLTADIVFHFYTRLHSPFFIPLPLPWLSPRAYWATEGSKHGCTSAITVSASALLCGHTILHVPPLPHGTGYCRTNMFTQCQTVPWVLRTHQLWWKWPPLNPYRSYSSPGSWRYCNQTNWCMLRLVALFPDPITQEVFYVNVSMLASAIYSLLALVLRLGDRVM